MKKIGDHSKTWEFISANIAVIFLSGEIWIIWGNLPLIIIFVSVESGTQS